MPRSEADKEMWDTADRMLDGAPNMKPNELRKAMVAIFRRPYDFAEWHVYHKRQKNKVKTP